MMAELMAQSAQECSKRSDVFANSCPHPDTNLHGIRVIVAEEFPWSSAPEPEVVWLPARGCCIEAPDKNPTQFQ